MTLPTQFAPWANYRRWVNYELIPDPDRPGKTIKRPVDVKSGHWCKAIDSKHQYSYGEAASTGRPVGFVIDKADSFWFLDADNAFDSTTGQWSQLVNDFAAKLQGAAFEVSSSGTGCHWYGFGAVPPHSCKNIPLGIELYTHDRFVALTFQSVAGVSVMHDATKAMTDLVARYFPPNAVNDFAGWTTEPVEEYGGPGNDRELLEAAMRSGKKGAAAAFGERHVTFEDLWTRNAEKLAARWPGKTDGFDASQADGALAAHLAYWTGKNCERTKELMLQSELVRDKWEARPDYLETTIMKASATVTNVAKGSVDRRAQRLLEDQRIGDDLDFPVVPSIVTLEEALNDFVFISDGRYIVSRTGKTVRKYEDALKEHAASKQLVETGDFENLTGKPKMRDISVVKLWLDSPSRFTVDTITWEPGAKEFCRAPERTQGGDRAYNLWVPPRLLMPPPNWQEWVKPFLDHVEYLVPIEAERYRFLCWLAHIFQHPGILPHTAYLMVATETGIGRGTLASILTRALRGYVAANINVDSLFGGFNGRCSQKLLATVDEIREGHSRDRYKNAEALKSKITEDIREVNRKYGLQTVEKNCCRWLMFSNHMDALPFDNNDRRIIVIENPSERRPPEWYGYLHGLMDNPMFIASVQHYLMTLDLMGYNPHEPAPINEAKRKALLALESPAGRKCREFVELWPDELATRADLVTFIGLDASPSRALDHDIQRAGMRTAHGQKVGGGGATVLIVRGALTPDDLLSVPKSEIAKRILAARAAFAFTDDHAG